jgi:hypothetical protein
MAEETYQLSRQSAQDFIEIRRRTLGIRERGPVFKPAQPIDQAGASGLWFELTGTYNASTGYPWKRLIPDGTGTDFTDASPAVTGDYLYDANGNESRISGERVFVRPHGTVSGNPSYMIVAGAGGDRICFKITNAAQDGTNKRWTYTAKRQAKTATGYGGWSNHAADTADYTLYNSLENMNGATGLYGNGVNSANLTGTFAIQRIPNDAIVWATAVTFTTGGTTYTEYWFESPNGIDGACP